MCLLVGGIFRHGLHEGRIACIIRTRLFASTSMLEIEAVSPTPLPRVVQVEHGDHIALAHLLQQPVETSQNGVVINARGLLQRWLDLRLDATLTIATHEDAEVVDAHALHRVEFLRQTFAIAALPLGTENGTIPEIGTHIIIRFARAHEVAVFHAYEVVFVGGFLCTTHGEHSGDEE